MNYQTRTEVLEARCKELEAMIGELCHEIQSYHIDWARLNSSSPDYDPSYKPTYPACVMAAAQLVARCTAYGTSGEGGE